MLRKMYSLIQRVNAVSGALNGLNAQVHTLNERVSTLSQQQPMMPPTQITSSQPNVSSDELLELKKLITKIQLELIDKHNELKKEIDTMQKGDVKTLIAKETKLLEASLMMKVEQTINKMMKDRLDSHMTDVKQYVEKRVESLTLEHSEQRNVPQEDEDYEINVTLNGEKEEPVPKKSARRAKKATT